MKSTTKTILIVEDDQALSDAYAMILRHAGYDVHVASDGQVALQRLDSVQPDMILLDMHMPVMDGLEFLAEYKKQGKHDARVVVFSNYDAKDTIDKAYELGAHRYVLKARASPKELLHLVSGEFASPEPQ